MKHQYRIPVFSQDTIARSLSRALWPHEGRIQRLLLLLGKFDIVSAAKLLPEGIEPHSVSLYMNDVKVE